MKLVTFRLVLRLLFLLLYLPFVHSCVSAVRAVFSSGFTLMYIVYLPEGVQHFIGLTENTLLTAGCVCLQGPSTVQASQDFSTLLTWTAGMSSQKTVNAAATTPRKSKSRIASQVQDGGPQ